MKVLRDNKESLMAVLEAFVYDPLINWRLMQTEADRRPEGTPLFDRKINVLMILVDADRAPELVRATAHPQAPIRKLKADENDIFNGNGNISCLG